MKNIPPFDPQAQCSPMATECPRCKNVIAACDGTPGFNHGAKPLCALTHLEALAELQAAVAQIARLTAQKAPTHRRARSLRRADDAPALPLPPLYHAVMADIERLMARPEETLTPAEGALLDVLIDVAMVYEQCCLPGWLFPDAADPAPPPPEGETP